MSPHFSSPPDRDFYYALVWEAVQKIPAGKVITYGQVAAMVPIPQGISPDDYKAMAPRWVGGAMASCPAGIPWQRVINSQGKISLPGESGRKQQELLEAEGIEFDARGRIDLNRFGWTGTSSGQLALF